MDDRPLTRRDILDCPACMMHYFDQPLLPMAAASVGIERGRSTQDMLVTYLAQYHRGGHREASSG